MKWGRYCLVVIICGAMGTTVPKELLPPLSGGYALREPADPPPQAKPLSYSQTSQHPEWVISQWGIDRGRLSPFERSGETFSSRAQTASVFGDGTSVRLSQDGSKSACEDAQHHPREVDLFFSPSIFEPLDLDRLAALKLDFRLDMTFGIGNGMGCAVSQGGTVVGFVLSNATTKQTLFYQVHFGSQQIHDGRLVVAESSAMFWFFPFNPFGVDDVFSSTQHLEIIQRLRFVLTKAPAGLDRELRHWRISSVYFGQHVWGNITVASTWKDLHLVAVGLADDINHQQ